MKKYFIGLMMLSLMFAMTTTTAQAKGQKGKVSARQETTIKGHKHPNAKVNKGNANNANVGASKRAEGKEKAIQRRLDGKEKAIERRLQGKQNAIENRSNNAAKRGHKGHGKHKRNLNNANNPHHINRGQAANANNNFKQEKNKKFIKQNGGKNRHSK